MVDDEWEENEGSLAGVIGTMTVAVLLVLVGVAGSAFLFWYTFNKIREIVGG